MASWCAMLIWSCFKMIVIGHRSVVHGSVWASHAPAIMCAVMGSGESDSASWWLWHTMWLSGEGHPRVLLYEADCSVVCSGSARCCVEHLQLVAWWCGVISS